MCQQAMSIEKRGRTRLESLGSSSHLPASRIRAIRKSYASDKLTRIAIVVRES